MADLEKVDSSLQDLVSKLQGMVDSQAEQKTESTGRRSDSDDQVGEMAQDMGGWVARAFGKQVDDALGDMDQIVRRLQQSLSNRVTDAVNTQFKRGQSRPSRADVKKAVDVGAKNIEEAWAGIRAQLSTELKAPELADVVADMAEPFIRDNEEGRR